MGKRDGASITITRRRLLYLIGVSAVGAVVQACAKVVAPITGGSAQGGAGAPATLPAQVPGVNAGRGAPAPTLVPGQVPITSNGDFYVVAYRSETPAAPTEWKLSIGGNVDKPQTFTLDDLKKLPAVEEMRTLECISNPAGGPLISNAVWKGVRMKDVLDPAGIKAGTVELKLESFDGYSTAIPLDLGMHEHSLLVYEMNGEPLPVEHGKPLRCLFPGRYGMKQPKWLTTITAVTSPYSGFWEQQGWSDDAFIKPNSRIDRPGEDAVIKTATFTVSGIGFSGEPGIAKIEVSLDEGKTWQEAKLTRGPTPYVWTVFDWSGPTPDNGELTLLARVTDNKGIAQTRAANNLFGGTFPSGTGAMQPVIVTVNKG